MGWSGMDEREKINVNNGDGEGGVNGGLVYPVMTEEQIQILRHQIVAYTIISEQLVQMYKSSIAQQHFFGMELGNPSCDPSMALGASKISSRRRRWAPTSVQLQILEKSFIEGNGTRTKEKMKEITNELAQHGSVTESNVYNWFQNRRARSKKRSRA